MEKRDEIDLINGICAQTFGQFDLFEFNFDIQKSGMDIMYYYVWLH